MSVPSNLPAWQELKAHHAAIADLHLRDLFATDPGRFAKFSRRFGDLLVDFSKHRITEEFKALIVLGHAFFVFIYIATMRQRGN